MSGIFHAESGLMRGMGRIADLIILNLLTLLCCLPVATMGAALAALLSSVRDMVNDVGGGGTVRLYFRHFRQDFRQATKLFLPLLPLFALVALGGYLLLVQPGAQPPLALTALYLLAAFFIAGTALMAFLLFVNFENTLAATLLNAARLVVARLPQVLLAVLLCYWVPLVFLLSPLVFLWLFIVLLLCGLSGPAFAVTLLFRPLMRRLAGPQAKDGEES